ncbi:universal stress protein [Craterilacuibacter sp. RT1T]|uniref:universal stress protein n=1 Tax=Craterilacuibacter sp. RT1T TaxID=2942211 RepID=UPI0020BE9AA8|nr:universal stress protein [Craterilacuibacter sp. RT1T]MCL6264754.1 universal stress protein [Craterilacuibacter sp. RT1T]
MYQNIVIALDGSHNAVLALQEAIKLAQVKQGKLILVHVASLRDISVEGVGMLGNHDLHTLAHERGAQIMAEAEALARESGISSVTPLILESWDGGKEMAKVLLAAADDHHADLIVVGTHGRGGLMTLLMGSFAETLLRMSPLPLLVVRNVHDDDENKLFEKRPVL